MPIRYYIPKLNIILFLSVKPLNGGGFRNIAIIQNIIDITEVHVSLIHCNHCNLMFFEQVRRIF